MRYLKLLLSCFLVATAVRAETNTNSPITKQTVVEAENLLGLHFSDVKNDLMLSGLKEQLDTFQVLRKFPLSNAIPSAMLFNPIPVGMKFETTRKKISGSVPE